MRALLLAVAVLALGACATVPDQSAMTVVERGARAAEAGYIAAEAASEQLVLTGALKRDDFVKWEARAYAGLTVIRVSFQVAEPANAVKPDYLALRGSSDDAHLRALQLANEAATSTTPP